MPDDCCCIACYACDGIGYLGIQFFKDHPTDCSFEVDYETCRDCGGSGLSKTCEYCMPEEE